MFIQKDEKPIDLAEFLKEIIITDKPALNNKVRYQYIDMFDTEILEIIKAYKKDNKFEHKIIFYFLVNFHLDKIFNSDNTIRIQLSKIIHNLIDKRNQLQFVDQNIKYVETSPSMAKGYTDVYQHALNISSDYKEYSYQQNLIDGPKYYALFSSINILAKLLGIYNGEKQFKKNYTSENNFKVLDCNTFFQEKLIDQSTNFYKEALDQEKFILNIDPFRSATIINLAKENYQALINSFNKKNREGSKNSIKDINNYNYTTILFLLGIYYPNLDFAEVRKRLKNSSTSEVNIFSDPAFNGKKFILSSLNTDLKNYFLK